MASIRAPLFINAVDVHKYLPIKKLVGALEDGFVEFSAKKNGLIQPQRMTIAHDEEKRFLVKPASSLTHKTHACKLLTVHQNNEPQFQLPNIQGILTVFDTVTGCFQGAMDAVAVTDVRTAAATAVAVKHLSRDCDRALAIIGTGHQGASHIEVLRQIRDFSTVRVFSRDKARREAFAKQHNCEAGESVEDTVRDADVIVVATSSVTPILQGEWVKAGALVASVGAPFPGQRELDDVIMLSSQIIADTMEGSYASAGDVILSGAKIDGELGDVISNKLTVDWQRTRIFKSNGMAIQDLIAGRIVVDEYMSATQ